MTRGFVAGVTVLALGASVGPAGAQTGPLGTTVSSSDTVHVAPPTGQKDSDRASILAALAVVPPGGMILFAPGIYRIRGLIQVSVPRVTLLGHPEGTTLRGCDFRELQEPDLARIHCDGDGLALIAGHQTVRFLTFEYLDAGLSIGIGTSGDESELRTPGIDGGHLIEGNTFRSSIQNVFVRGQSSRPIVIRNNRFVNTYHAVIINGKTAHVLDNDIAVPDPQRVPRRLGSGVAVGVAPVPRSRDEESCTGNVVAGNRIAGHPAGIVIRVVDPGQRCWSNVIRDNTIAVRDFRLDSADQRRFGFEAGATVMGVPLTLLNQPESCRLAAQCRPGVSVSESDPEASIEDNLIEGNRIIGVDGLGIAIQYASRNRIVNNTIRRVMRKNPFPSVVPGRPPVWRAFNGSAIWVSPGSNENEILGNTFEDIAGHTVVLEGDRNVVAVRRASDSVRDLGSGNRVSVNGTPTGARAPALGTAARGSPSDIVETGRLIFHQLMHPVGEESYRLASDHDGYALRVEFVHRDRGRTIERSVALRLGPDLAPRDFRLREPGPGGDTTVTAVEVNRGAVTVTEAGATQTSSAPGRFFTASGYAPYAVQTMLLRYWLRHGEPDSITIFPAGHAIIRRMGRDTVASAGATRVLDRYSVGGISWGGQTLWLDGEERLVAAVTFEFPYEGVREGYESALPFFAERARRDALTRGEEMARSIGAARSGTLALVGGVLIEGTGAPPLDDAAVVIRDGRIAAVGRRGSVEVPGDAAVIEVTGRTLLPGLWDMHAHVGGIVDLGPIYLATGVTTARSLGDETDWLVALREAFETGRLAGPRLLLAAEVDGKVPQAVGPIQAGSPDEARALVHRFHELGFQQMKIYGSLKPELVGVIADESHRLGMTVTGHVPFGMTAVEAVEAGMDEVNHVISLVTELVPDSVLQAGDDAVGAALAHLDPGSPRVRRMVDALLRHRTVLDPTLANLELTVRPASLPLHDVEPGVKMLPPDLALHVARRQRGGPVEGSDLRQAIFRRFVALVGALHRAGVPIVAGTDVNVPGHTLHRELELYVEAGMTPLEAIQAASIVPARAMRLDGEVGTIEPGKRADLIVVEGDPLRSIREIRNVRAVVANGRMYDTAALWRSVGFTMGGRP